MNIIVFIIIVVFFVYLMIMAFRLGKESAKYDAKQIRVQVLKDLTRSLPRVDDVEKQMSFTIDDKSRMFMSIYRIRLTKYIEDLIKNG